VRGEDHEHRTAIRRASSAPVWVVLALLGAIALLVLGNRDAGDGDGAVDGAATTVPATPTSETLTTTAPRDRPPIHGLTRTSRGLLPFSTAVAPMADSADAGPDDIEVVAGPIVTVDQVVVLDATQVLHIGAPGGSFRRGACCWDELHPSSEPRHVWGRLGDRVELLPLDDLDPPRRVTLDVGDADVLGPGTFGVVTVDDRNVVRWHRPSFEPSTVRLPGDRVAIDSGGERLLVAAPATTDQPARLEVWSTTGNGILHAHPLDDGASADGHLAPDGSVALVPAAGGWQVLDAATGAARGWLSKTGSRPVWVGGATYAAAVDRRLVVSDGGELPLRWPVLAVAEQSP
jgi:hypothetical protein